MTVYNKLIAANSLLNQFAQRDRSSISFTIIN